MTTNIGHSKTSGSDLNAIGVQKIGHYTVARTEAVVEFFLKYKIDPKEIEMKEYYA